MRNLVFILSLFFLSGCAMLGMRGAEVYPLSFDQTYQVALEALDDMDPYYILETDHKEGKITVENPHFFIQDNHLYVIVKRISPFETKVQLDGHWPTPFNQRFFRAIDRRIRERILTYPT